MYVTDLSMDFRESASSARLVKVGLLMSKYAIACESHEQHPAVPDNTRTKASCAFCDGGKVRGANGDANCNGKSLSQCCMDANVECKGSEYGFLGQCEQCSTGKGTTVDVKVCNCLRVSRTSFHSARHYKNQGVVRLLSRWNSQRQKREQHLQR